MNEDKPYLAVSAAAAKKRKQRQRKSPEEAREERLSNTTARSIARENPEVRRREQLHNTASRSMARENPEVRRREQRNRKKWFPLGCSVDEITGEYKFDQPCGVWNKPCAYGCGYIHLSSASPGTLSRC